MAMIRYEEGEMFGKRRVEATLSDGAVGFAGIGATREEAQADLLRRLERYWGWIGRAMDELRSGEEA